MKKIHFLPQSPLTMSRNNQTIAFATVQQRYWPDWILRHISRSANNHKHVTIQQSLTSIWPISQPYLLGYRSNWYRDHHLLHDLCEAINCLIFLNKHLDCNAKLMPTNMTVISLTKLINVIINVNVSLLSSEITMKTLLRCNTTKMTK